MPISNVWVTLVDLLPLIGGWMTFRNHGKGLRILFYYCALAIPFDVLNLSLRVLGFNNLWVLHVFTMVEYTMLAWLSSLWAEEDVRRYIRISIVAFTILWIVSKIFFEPFDAYDSFTSTAESVLIIVMTTYLLIQISATVERISTDCRFWALTGLLIYFAGNFTIFALRNFIYYWFSHNVILTLTNVLLLKAFLCSRKPSSSLY